METLTTFVKKIFFAIKCPSLTSNDQGRCWNKFSGETSTEFVILYS